MLLLVYFMIIYLADYGVCFIWICMFQVIVGNILQWDKCIHLSQFICVCVCDLWSYATYEFFRPWTYSALSFVMNFIWYIFFNSFCAGVSVKKENIDCHSVNSSHTGKRMLYENWAADALVPVALTCDQQPWYLPYKHAYTVCTRRVKIM